MSDWRTKPEPEPLRPGGRVKDLPEGVRQIAEVIGRWKALAFVAAIPTYPRKGGGISRSIYIPRRLHVYHPLVQAIGRLDAEKLANKFGGEIINPGAAMATRLAARDQWIFEQAARGVTAGEIAKSVNLSVRRVKGIAKAVASASGIRSNRWRVKVEIPQEEKPG